MDLYVTEIKAICPKTGDLKVYCGPHVPGISFFNAQEYCQNNGLGYCRVIGILVAEIPCKDLASEPEWNKMIDYENIKLN